MEKLTFEARFLVLYKYLAGCTSTELQQFELSRLNKASNLRKQLNEIAAELGTISAETLLARSVREARQGKAPAESSSFEYLLSEAAETGKQLNVTVAQLISVSAVACAAHMLRENYETLPHRTVDEELLALSDGDLVPGSNDDHKQRSPKNEEKITDDGIRRRGKRGRADTSVGTVQQSSARRGSLLENWKKRTRELKMAPKAARQSEPPAENKEK